MRRHLAACALVVAPALASAQGVKTYDYPGTFEDAAFGVESAIVNRDLVIDFVSQVGEMLARTKEDVGGKDLFREADIYLFCSAVASREVMEADPMNIGHCPYAVFVTEDATTGQVKVGYREMPEGPMQEIEVLLDDIAREAVGGL